jgi:hypothetical protein
MAQNTTSDLSADDSIDPAADADRRGTGEPCETKRQLLDAYQVATEAFARAVTVLNDWAGTSSRDEYERLRAAVDEARLKSEAARLMLEGHVASHGC